jgi:hypothetical protein
MSKLFDDLNKQKRDNEHNESEQRQKFRDIHIKEMNKDVSIYAPLVIAEILEELKKIRDAGQKYTKLRMQLPYPPYSADRKGGGHSTYDREEFYSKIMSKIRSEKQLDRFNIVRPDFGVCDIIEITW